MKRVQPSNVSLYHITHARNIASVVKNGILSHNEAYERGLIKRDISNSRVQDIREEKHDPFYRRALHDYASLYITPMNPMMRQLQIFHQDVVLLTVTPHVILRQDAVFTDGNASAKETKFYRRPSDLSNLRWDVLEAPDWEAYEDGKRIRCAEVLIYPKVNPIEILSILCQSPGQYAQIIRSNNVSSLKSLLEIRPDVFVVP